MRRQQTPESHILVGNGLTLALTKANNAESWKKKSSGKREWGIFGGVARGKREQGAVGCNSHIYSTDWTEGTGRRGSLSSAFHTDRCGTDQGEGMGQGGASPTGQGVQSLPGHADTLGGGQQHICPVPTEGDQGHLVSACVRLSKQPHRSSLNQLRALVTLQVSDWSAFADFC